MNEWMNDRMNERTSCRLYEGEKLDTEKYVNCAKKEDDSNTAIGSSGARPLPSMEGLPLEPPMEMEKFTWAPGHDQAEEDEAGDESLEAARKAAARAAEDPRSPSKPWGSCALVGAWGGRATRGHKIVGTDPSGFNSVWFSTLWAHEVTSWLQKVFFSFLFFLSLHTYEFNSKNVRCTPHLRSGGQQRFAQV